MKSKNINPSENHELTMCLRAYVEKEDGKWKKYGPFAAMARLLIGLLVKGLR
jgi:hypothetical protein